MGFSVNAHSKAVGQDLLAVLPQDGKSWYARGYLFKLNMCILALVMYSSANGYDGSLMNGIQALEQWNTYTGHPTGAWLGFLNAVYWLSAGITQPVAAWTANKYGRKRGVYIAYFWLLLGTGVVFSHQSFTFVLSRVFIGIASGWFGNSVPLLINEIAYPTHRGIANALYLCGWYVGGLIAGFATYGTRDFVGDWGWRIPYLLQLILPLVALPGLIFAPESPRWLISVGREQEAREALVASHGGGDHQSPLVKYEMAQITGTIIGEQETHQASGYTDMVKTPGNRKRLFISITLGLFSQWSGNGVVSYYLALVLQTVGITSVAHQTLLAGFLQVWNLFFAVAAAFSVDRLGRRALFLSSAVVMSISFIVVTALSGSFASTQNAATGIAVIPMLFIFFAGYDIALTPLAIAYPCEIWPYHLRAKGIAVQQMVTIGFLFFNVFVNPIALESIGWKYYFVFIVVCISFGVTAYFYYPETRGYTLEGIASIFDGEDAVSKPTVVGEDAQEASNEKDAIVVTVEAIRKASIA